MKIIETISPKTGKKQIEVVLPPNNFTKEEERTLKKQLKRILMRKNNGLEKMFGTLKFKRSTQEMLDEDRF